MTRTRRSVAIAAAAVTAGAAVVAYLLLHPAGGHGRVSANDPATWPSFGHPVSFRYPPTWNEHLWTSAGSMGNSTFVYLSNRALVRPCDQWWNGAHKAHSGGCEQFAATHLDAGDVAVTWREAGFVGPGRPLTSVPGTPTVINGHPARIAISGASVECRRLGGQTSIEAAVLPTHFQNEIYVMNACIAAGSASSQAAQVLTSLHTFR